MIDYPIILDSELMAEKLGLIVLCQNCGERIYRCEKLTGQSWLHEKTNEKICETAYRYTMTYALPRRSKEIEYF